MFLTPEEAQQAAEKVAEVPPEEFLQNLAEGQAPELLRNPSFYKAYGPYWWAIKECLRQYCKPAGNGPTPWFLGEYEDSFALNRVWAGSLFLTVFAGLNYANHQHWFETSDHYLPDAYGNLNPYTLFDEDAGQ